jgi:DNA-binding CsgD family transcriptional regulator
MTNLSIKKDRFHGRSARQEQQFFASFAQDYLIYFGNPQPSKKQVAACQGLLSHVWLRRTLCLDSRLTEQERRCLYLSAQGKRLKDIAAFLNISVRCVERYRQSVFQKLECNNIAEAIALGVRYGEIAQSLTI